MTVPGATAELPASLQNAYSSNDANFPEAGGVLKLHFCWFKGLKKPLMQSRKSFRNPLEFRIKEFPNAAGVDKIYS